MWGAKRHNGKNSKIWYYLTSHFGYWVVPNSLYRLQLKGKLARFERLSSAEQEYVMNRVNYYCSLINGVSLSDSPKILGEHSYSNSKGSPSAYFFDSYRYTRYFNPDYSWEYLFGDVAHVAQCPSITKSRPLVGYRSGVVTNDNNVLLPLDKVRHFFNISDVTPYRKKMDKALFRGDIAGKKRREIFVEKFVDHPLCDVGDVTKGSPTPAEWKRPPLTIEEHLKYKFIISLEGNDVATNLKWIMSSNSLAVMPHPTCETWYMEGMLKGGEHYIEIAQDYSDLQERLDYYIGHPTEAEQIVENAQRYRAQFNNDEREELIALMVLTRYFQATGQ